MPAISCRDYLLLSWNHTTGWARKRRCRPRYFQICGTAAFLRCVGLEVNFMELLIMCWFGCDRLRGIDHRRYEMFQRCGWIAAPAGVNWRSLNDCAARCDEPVKTLTLR